MSDAAAFLKACKDGRIAELSQMLLDDASLLNARSEDETPAIIHATCAKQIDVVTWLIEHGCDIEAKDAFYKGTALGFAAWHGYDDIAVLLVERGADVNAGGEDPSPLALALDGVDGKLAAEGSPGSKEGHAAIAALLDSRGGAILGRIGDESSAS